MSTTNGGDAPLPVSAPATAGERGRPTRVAPLGIGLAVPAGVVSSAEIERRLGLDAGWIQSRTHIEERRWLAPDAKLADLATDAGRRALADAGVEADEVDLVIAATITPDEITPALAVIVAAQLEAHRAGGYDIHSGCSGFVTALATATAMVEAGRARTVLVVAAEAMSRITNPDDRATAGLLADGAGAVVIRGAYDEGVGRIGPSVFGSDGGLGGTVWVPTDRPSVYDERYTRGKDNTVVMNGHETYLTAVRHHEQLVLDTVAADGATLDDIDLFVLHQANGRILEAVRKRLGLEPDRLVNLIGQRGNTSAATVVIALADLHAQGRLQHGTRVVLAAFGSGLAWAGMSLTWEGGR